jgi:modulator of FtsH protease HflC
MRRLRRFLLVFMLVGLLVALIVRSAVIVDETEYVLVTEFGRPLAIYGDGQAGLHLKLPWQSARSIDRRLRVFDPPPRTLITADKRNLEVASYVAWRVVDADRFVRSAGTHEAAEARLSERVSAALSHAFGTRELAAVASSNPNVWALDSLTEELRGTVAAPALEEMGVEVVDIRLRRFNHPVEVRPAVFDLIRSERRQVAASLRAEGEAQYQILTSQADRERDALLARAEADAERIKGKAEADAMRVLNEAHARDPKFYEFVRALETYRSLLDDKATVVLSTASPFLKLLTQGPPDDLLRDATPGERIASPLERKP